MKYVFTLTSEGEGVWLLNGSEWPGCEFPTLFWREPIQITSYEANGRFAMDTVVKEK